MRGTSCQGGSLSPHPSLLTAAASSFRRGSRAWCFLTVGIGAGGRDPPAVGIWLRPPKDSSYQVVGEALLVGGGLHFPPLPPPDATDRYQLEGSLGWGETALAVPLECILTYSTLSTFFQGLFEPWYLAFIVADVYSPVAGEYGQPELLTLPIHLRQARWGLEGSSSPWSPCPEFPHWGISRCLSISREVGVSCLQRPNQDLQNPWCHVPPCRDLLTKTHTWYLWGELV